MVFIFTLLILLVMLISGRSDAAGAVSACVSLRSMPEESAIRLAAISTLLGSILLPLFNMGVADTFFGIADFGEEPQQALLALCSALGAVILWSVTARHFGLPVIETHAMVSGISGASLGIRLHLSALHAAQWRSVLLGLLMSTLPSFLLSFCFHRLLQHFLAGQNRRSVMSYFLRSQRFSAAWSAALLGAQDTQKYMGVYLLGISLCQGEPIPHFETLSLSVLLLCAGVMTMGTLLSSGRLVKTIGQDMTEPDAPSFSAANAASSLVMTLCTLLGLPAGLLQARLCALMGAAICRKNRVDLRVVGRILLLWALTFPVCGGVAFLLSYTLTHL